MLQCHSRALSKNIDFTRQNKTLLNIIKSCKEIPADNDFECSEEDGKVYSYDEWLPLSVPEHKSKCVAKRKLFCISNDNPPKKAKKKKKMPAAENNQRMSDEENVEQPTSDHHLIIS